MHGGRGGASAQCREVEAGDVLKQLDEEIVLNSVRFRWQEVRRHFARDLDANAVIASLDSRAAP